MPHLRSVLSFLAAALAVSPSVSLADVASHTFDAKGVKIHYLVEGKGDPVILIHGLHSSADVNWRKPGVMAALARDHQVIALDMPGHGGSDKPERDAAYGAQMAEDVVLLMDHLKIKKAHVVGYSMGGMVTVKLLATHPDRVRSAVIGGMGWMKEGGRLQNFWERIPPREGSRTPSACVRGIAKLAITEDELKAIRVPALILVGDRDPVRQLYVAPLQTVRKDWKVMEIEGAGHLNCIIKKQFQDEIVAWVTKQTQP